MAALTRRDIDLIFKAETQGATKDIGTLAKSVGTLSQELEQQVAAAKRGEGSMEALQSTAKQLAAAFAQIKDVTGEANGYPKLIESLKKTKGASVDAQKALDDLQAKVDKSAKASDSLVERRDRAARKVAKLAADEERLTRVIGEQEKALEALGIDVKQFGAGQELIANTAQQAARAINDASKALDGYGAVSKSAAADKARANAMLNFDSLAAKSGLGTGQIEGIRQTANDAAAAALRVRDYTGALEASESAVSRITAATKFQQIAAAAEASARDVARFGAQADTVGTNFERLANSVRGLVQPAEEAARTMAGVVAQVEAAEATLASTKKLRPEQYSDAINELSRANAGLVAQAGQVDGFRVQQAAVNALEQEFEQARQKVLQLSAAFDATSDTAKADAAAIAQAEAAMARLGRELSTDRTKLEQMSRALKAAGIDTRKLDAEMNRITLTAQRAGNAMGQLTQKTNGSGALFGLKPHELTNLGYQVNDIVVSLAAGQNPMTVFAQQGAQIGQIIPGSFAKIFAYLPQLAVLGTLFLVAASAMGEAASEAGRLRQAEGIIALLGDRTNVTAVEVEGLTDRLGQMGVSAADAGKSVQLMLTQGLNAEQIADFTEIARDMSDTLGIEIPEAMALLGGAASGSVEELIKLAEATGALDDATLAQIETLVEDGRVMEARELIFDRVRAKQQEVADLQRGSWSEAARALGNSWRNLIKAIADTSAIKDSVREFEHMAGGLIFILTLLKTGSVDAAKAARNGRPFGNAPGTGGGKRGAPGSNSGALDDTDPGEARIRARRRAREDAELRRTRAGREKLLKRESYRAGVGSPEQIERQVAEDLAAFRREEDIKAAKEGERAGKKAAGVAARAAKKAAAERKRAAKKAETDRKAAERERERERAGIERDAEGLERALESLTSKASKAAGESFEAVMAGIDQEYDQLFDKIDEFSARTGGKGLIDGMDIPSYRKAVEAQIVILKNAAGIKKIEQEVNQLNAEQADKLEEIQDLRDKNRITPDEAIARTNDVLAEMQVKMNDLITKSRAWAAALPGGPEKDRVFAKLDSLAQENAPGQRPVALTEAIRKEMNTAEDKLNDIIARRNALVGTQNTLVELGLKTARQAQRDTAQIFKDTESSILKAADALEAFMNANPDAVLAGDMEVIRAGLAAVRAEARYINPELVQMEANMKAAIAQNIIAGIDAIAQAFARMAVGQQSVLDTLEDIARAFLMMIAETLKAIAMLIIQAFILDAVDKATGGMLKPLLKIYAASIQHEGGVTGSTGRSRKVHPAVFANAPRYHSGGIAGLAPDEVPSILRRGEEVLKQTDPRHRMNGGLREDKAPSARGIRQVLAFGDDQIAGAMAGASGEEVVVTHIRRNKRAIKQLLDS